MRLVGATESAIRGPFLFAVVAPGTLEIKYVWPAGECVSGLQWKAYFTVKIAGGDGRNYAIFWEQEKMVYSVKQEEKDVAIIQVPTNVGLLVGTVWVESGGQRGGQAISANRPTNCK